MPEYKSEQGVMSPEQIRMQQLLKAKREQQSGNALAIVPNRLALIVDTSSSMLGSFPPNSTRYEAARVAMTQLITKSNSRDTHYCLIVYNNESNVIHPMSSPYGKILMTKFDPQGGTSLNPALGLANGQNINRAIVLSDGEIFDRARCLETVNLIYLPKKIKIDTIAIGEADVTFLQQLSELTGGKFKAASNVSELQQRFLECEPSRYLLEHKES